MYWKLGNTHKKITKKNSGEQEKKKKPWSIKSCLSVLLSVTITVTTVYTNVLYAQAEAEKITAPTKFRFCSLEPEQAVLNLSAEKGTLEDTIKYLPETLKIIAETTETPSTGEQPTVSSGDPAIENDNSQNTDPSFPENDTPDENNGSDPSPENGSQNGDENVIPSPSGNSPTGSEDYPSSQGIPDNYDSSASLTGSSGTVVSPVIFTDASDSMINILSMDSVSGNSGSETGSSAGSDNPVPEADDSQPADINTPGTDGSQNPAVINPADGVSENTDQTNGTVSAPVPETPQAAEISAPPAQIAQTPGENAEPVSEIPVSWECANYNDISDSYIFTPTWDQTKYCYTGDEKDIPTITVTFAQVSGLYIVSTEQELRDALDKIRSTISSSQTALEDQTVIKIMLANDIALTQTLNVPDLPANMNIYLESRQENGQNIYSLTRSSPAFQASLLIFGALKNTGDTTAGGTLTFSNITIDGKITTAPPTLANSADMSHASAVISYGNLILDNGASIINNYNIGTPHVENGIATVAEDGSLEYDYPPYGGGLLAYEGSVTLRKGSSIRSNIALLGGGLYLGSNAVLHLYADVLKDNSTQNGIGADLYAAAGSTIYYYDPTINMKRAGFYIDPAATLILEGSLQDTTTPIEIFLNVCENSGYSLNAVKEKLESAFGGRVKVLVPQIHTVTTDLKKWAVYDHYDTNCWPAEKDWNNAYKDYDHRPYFAYTSVYTYGNANPNHTGEILNWIENPIFDSTYRNELGLVPLKEHIYSNIKGGGRPEMIFVGYDQDPNVDFLFYNPKSDGKKIVEFDVDSSKVNTHTLAGTGFLIDTGITDKKCLSGYLVYYRYTTGTSPASIALYKFENMDIEKLHSNTSIYNTIVKDGNLRGQYSINNWQTDMSIKITVDSGTVTVEQSPKNDSSPDNVTTYTWDNLPNTGYSGFGPLVAYNSHGCGRASSFTYSNLHMQYVTPTMEEKDLLYPLMEADYTQNVSKKYFLNLLGSSNIQYNTTADLGNYLPFLDLMQQEGIGLITDAKNTPFEPYLGADGSQNLCLLKDLAGKSDLDALVESLTGYLSMYSTTDITGIELKKRAAAENTSSIGNIYLADAATNTQIPRVLDRNNLPGNYCIKVMDISCIRNTNDTIEYALLKPDSSEYIPLPLGSSNDTGTETAAYFNMPGTPGVSFIITNDPVEWPDGLYTVRQQVGGNELYGYSYFTLTRGTIEPQIPSVPAPGNAGSAETAQTVETVEFGYGSGSSSGHSGYTPEIRTTETVPANAVSTPVPSDGAAQPKTGDNMLPVMPVACGACTAFMLKIMLWMYDIDLDMITLRKEEIVRSLIRWGKGSTKLRIYVTIFAIVIVLTAYHLLKAFSENSRQAVKARFGI